MYGPVCSNSGAVEYRVKHFQIGFACANVSTADSAFEVSADADAINVGVAVGQRKETVPLTQVLQDLQRPVIKHHLITAEEKHVECP